jgi:hypothetical protein
MLLLIRNSLAIWWMSYILESFIKTKSPQSRQIFSPRLSEFTLASAAVCTDVEVATPKAIAISWIINRHHALIMI